jgi:Zn-finger nucleic acid-binding protein
MRCPVYDTDLRAVDRQGIEIDICPRCRGVWLDRGELDKLLERSAAYESRRDDDDDDDDRRPRGDYEGRGGYEPRGGHPPEGRREHKRKGFWSNLFDSD